MKVKAGPREVRSGTHPTKEGSENRITRAHACLQGGASLWEGPPSPQRRQNEVVPRCRGRQRNSLRKNTEVLTIN